MTGAWQLDCGTDGTILFGPQSTRYPFAVAPEIGDPNRDNQDSDLPGVDGSLFGIDSTSGQTIAFGLTAVGETDAEANALHAAFRRVWRADSIRRTPGATATLTAPSGRSTFGRPRRITPTFYPDDAGAVGITADFATQNDLWYGPEQTLRVPLGLSQGGGLVLTPYTQAYKLVETPPGSGLFDPAAVAEDPVGSGLYSTAEFRESASGTGLYGTARNVLTHGLKSPLVARGSSLQSNTFIVDGELPAWPIITIHGQITNPVVTVAGAFRFASPVSLRYDETLTIDTRPGMRSVLRNGTQIAALARSSDLLEAGALSPGAHTLTLSGSASTGSPAAVMSWRSVYPTP
ncbi:hypothetical protein E9228_002764 [Curtobacterium flaccumfaciens]|uniref:Minor tail protein n=1 Tax=Curtobacterium salicis TaxID=1779862 RepID=A0ABX0T9A7_9MICO|nr:hypothetical protein [Curtobacterium sp. WW7]NII42106.1 hypothetical protein [Curtobacterium sp. WW7]